MKHGFKRADRVADLIKREIGEILIREELGVDFGLATISHVELTDDLRNAKIYLSILGDEAEQKKSFGELVRSKKRIRMFLAKRLNLRYTPTLKLFMDQSLERAIRVQKIINDLHREEE